MGLADGYNFATQVDYYPCASPNPLIWAATFAPAVAPAFLEFLSFGCRDMLKFRAGIGAPCGRAMKAQVKKFTPPALTSTVGNLMKFERTVSTAGFWGLIADLATDTTMRWLTLAYTFNECTLFTDDAHWQYAPTAAHAVLPNIEYAIAGNIINLQGNPLWARPEGAIVPDGFYFQGNFEAEAQSLISGARIGIATWIRKIQAGTYDYPANVYSPGYPGQNAVGQYMFSTHTPNRGTPTEYRMMIRVNELALVWIKAGVMAVTNTPPVNWAMSPLACLRDLTVTRQENPAGRNRSSPQNALDKAIFAALPKIPNRGRPGGMPRSKK